MTITTRDQWQRPRAGASAGPGPGGSGAFFGAIIQAPDPQTVTTSTAADILLPDVLEDSGGFTGTANKLTFPFAGTYDFYLTVGITKTSPGDELTDGSSFEINLRFPSDSDIEAEMARQELEGPSFTSRTIAWSTHMNEGDEVSAFCTNYFNVDIDIKGRGAQAGAVLSCRLRKAD